MVTTLIYTFFFLMMLSSHFLTVRTSPGQMPKDYKELIKDDLSKDFYDLIHLRETLHAELAVRKKMRRGELTCDMVPNF